MNKFEQQYRQWGAIALVSMVTMLLIIAILDYLLKMDFGRNFYISALIGASFLMGIISMSWIQVLNTRLMRADVKKANDPPIPQEETRKITQDDIELCIRKEGYIPQVEEDITFFKISGERFEVIYQDHKFTLGKRFGLSDDTDIDMLLKACSQAQDEIFMFRSYVHKYDNGQPMICFEVETYLDSAAELDKYFLHYLNVLLHAVERQREIYYQMRETVQKNREEHTSSSSREPKVVS
jgi:hypothetical protein